MSTTAQEAALNRMKITASELAILHDLNASIYYEKYRELAWLVSVDVNGVGTYRVETMLLEPSF